MADPTKTRDLHGDGRRAEPRAAPRRTRTPRPSPRAPVRIIMAGDSLTRTYAANAADQAGWGQVLAQFLTSDATVDNTLSNGGRSSRSFYNELGRWDQVKAAPDGGEDRRRPGVRLHHVRPQRSEEGQRHRRPRLSDLRQPQPERHRRRDLLRLPGALHRRDARARRHSDPVHAVRAPVPGGQPGDRHHRRAAQHHGAVRRRDRRARRLSGGREGGRRQARRPDRRHHVLEQDDGRGARRRRARSPTSTSPAIRRTCGIWARC